MNSDDQSSQNELDEYSGGQIKELKGTPVPLLLKLTYVLMPIIGLIGFYQYWNGSEGFLDTGYWYQLQQAAKTTYPFQKPLSSQEKTYIESIEPSGKDK